MSYSHLAWLRENDPDHFDAAGAHTPLAIWWPGRSVGGRRVTDLVNLTDLAPTLLDAAGCAIPKEMTGNSLMPQLISKVNGQIDPSRDATIFGRERHGWNRTPNVGYPMRAIRTADYLFIRNYALERHPGFDTDDGPTKSALISEFKNPKLKTIQDGWFNPRPPEELYRVSNDQHEIQNLATNPEYKEIVKTLRTRLDAYLKTSKDPRHAGRGSEFDQHPYYGGPTHESKVGKRLGISK